MKAKPTKKLLPPLLEGQGGEEATGHLEVLEWGELRGVGWGLYAAMVLRRAS